MEQPPSSGAGSGDDDLRRVRELLQAHAQRRDVKVTETVEGTLSVTFDSQMRIVAAQVLDGSVDAKARAALERAIVEAVNRAMTRVVQSSTEALQALQQSAEWRHIAEQIAARVKAQGKRGTGSAT